MENGYLIDESGEEISIQDIVSHCSFVYGYLNKDNDRDPFEIITDQLNLDLGGTLSWYLIHHDIEVTQIEYEIILLKIYNRLMEDRKN